MQCRVCYAPTTGKKYCSPKCEKKAWKLRNREKYLLGKRKYQFENKEKVREYNRIWADANPDKVKIYNASYKRRHNVEREA